MIYLFYFDKRARIKGLIPKLHIFGRNYIYNLYSSSNLTCLTSIVFFELIVTMVSCCIPMDFLYQFSYGVRVNLGLKKNWCKRKLTCRLAALVSSARSCISDSPCKYSDLTLLGVTPTTDMLCLTSIVQIARRLYNIHL